MDIDDDYDHNNSSKAATSTKHRILPIDDAHPFDLEAYLSSYTGRTIVDRILFIIPLCPTIAPQAFHLAVKQIKQMRDPLLYQQLLPTYESNVGNLDPEHPLPSWNELGPYEQKWVDDTYRRNSEEKIKLEMELKTYTSNMIKESVRMAHRDLANFHRATGDPAAAQKHYAKLREFCTTSQHVLDMCISFLELLLEQRNYAHIPTYVFKAEPALDATTNMLRNVNQGPTATAAPPGKEKIAAEREKVQSKLDLATAISQLGQGAYEKAAATFVRVGPPKALGHWATKIAAPSDIAIYGVLCALATWSRSNIKSQLLDNEGFSVYIEQEPYIRELVEAYMGSRFSTVLEILERYSTRHMIDIHLSPHVQSLTTLIRNRALVLYFQPFASIKMERMSTAFGWTVEQLEEQVLPLIQSGDIKARVDKQNKILKARDIDQRAQLFARAVKSGNDMLSANRKLLLRMRLQQADLIVKPPKERSQGQTLGEMAGNENYR